MFSVHTEMQTASFKSVFKKFRFHVRVDGGSRRKNRVVLSSVLGVVVGIAQDTLLDNFDILKFILGSEAWGNKTKEMLYSSLSHQDDFFVLFGIGLLICFVPLFSHDTSIFSKRRNPCLNYICQKLVLLKQILILIFTEIWMVLKPFRHFVYHLLNKCTRKTEAIFLASSISCIDILTLLT